jgi:hypothetical protein
MADGDVGERKSGSDTRSMHLLPFVKLNLIASDQRATS